MEIKASLIIPADVPENKRDTFSKNYLLLTRETGRLFIFSCDHKIEHLNKDFYGPSIHPQALHPEHLFRIASYGNIGGTAMPLGLIARYAPQYTTAHYIAKLNGTTHTSPQHDPCNDLLWTVDDVVRMKNNNKLSIPGIGITLYLGNQHESALLAQTAQVINRAHQEGFVTIVWIYARGSGQAHIDESQFSADAAGVGVSLGADFIKIKVPASIQSAASLHALKIASAAAGNSKILCAGGEKVDHELYLRALAEQLQQGDTAGTATGRNIFQLSLPESIALTHAIAALVYENSDYKAALEIYHAHLAKKLT